MAKQTETKTTRPPVISVLGHVDHGKTSLLDYIRSAHVAAGESGGITQHIGAYQATYKDRLLTLIDTPGHQAFGAMRARGGQAADLAVLVVAAEDGVMPQTKESINHIKTAGIPFVVVINKIDLPNANPDQVKGQLAQEGVLVEGYGGNIPVALVSAKTGKGIPELLDVLLLMADLEELESDADGELEAMVIESNLDSHKGPVATLLVKKGTLKLGEQLISSEGGKPSKVKALLDWQGQRIESAGPSTPILVLGFNEVLPVGALVTHEGVTLAKPLQEDAKEAATISIPMLVKADFAGTLEAVLGSLPKEITVIGSGTGPIGEADVLLAQTTKSKIVGFRVKPITSAKRLSEIEGVPILTFTTIYDLLENIEELVKAGIEAAKAPGPTGSAKVVQMFEHNGVTIIGAKVTSGIIRVGDSVTVKRKGEEKGTSVVKTLRIGRDNKDRVTINQEFGLVPEEKLDIKAEDDIIALQNG